MQQQHSQSMQNLQQQQIPNIQLHSTPQFNQIQEQINESEFEDFVPISSNIDPNLHFPASSTTYININNNSTTSFNSNYFPQSISGNSISSNLTQTPLQNSRRLSATALHNITSTPSQTPSRKQSNFVTPRIVGQSNITFSHKRSKSKINIEKSPATGNPFYNPPSFLSPKVNKKSHKKNISITNSISLSHLDTDLNLQQIHQLVRSGSPNDTPLRTPGRENDIRYMYDDDDEDEDDNIGNDIDNNEDGDVDGDGDNDNDKDNDEGYHDNNIGKDNIDDDNNEIAEDNINDDDDNLAGENSNFGEDDEDDYVHDVRRNIDDIDAVRRGMLAHNSQTTSGINQQSTNNSVVNIDDSVFIMPNVLMKHKFGEKLMQSSNDLNNVISENLDHENEPSIFDNISSNNYANYLNGMFIPESTTVESLQNDIFSYSSNEKNVPDSYYDVDNEAQQKYQYKKKSSIPQIHLQQSLLHNPHQQQQYQTQQSPHRYSEPNVVLNASVLQTKRGTSVESKLQRSGPSFNLSNIASFKEGKVPNQQNDEHFRYSRGPLINYTDTSPQHLQQQQQHQHQQQQHRLHQQQQPYSNYDHKVEYENMNTPMNTASLSNIPISSSNSSKISASVGNNNNITGIKTSTSLQEVAESVSSRTKDVSLSHSDSTNKIFESPTIKTRSRSKRTSFTLTDIKNPEKLDLPQQSARSRSRSKKNPNDEKKIHECPLCHMKFQRPEHVKRHMLSHSSEKPFECTEEGCHKRFNRNDNLKQHLRNIHKKKI